MNSSNNPVRAIGPRSAIARWAIGASILGLAAWFVLPWITDTFRNIYPITDTWLMPAIGTFLIDLAAILNVLAIWRWKERSVMNIAAAVITVPLALCFTLFFVGESLSGL